MHHACHHFFVGSAGWKVWNERAEGTPTVAATHSRPALHEPASEETACHRRPAMAGCHNHTSRKPGKGPTKRRHLCDDGVHQARPAKVSKFGFKRLAECASMALAGLRCGWHAVPRAARPLLCSRAKSYVMPLARAYILFRCKCTHCEYERSQSARVGCVSVCWLLCLHAPQGSTSMSNPWCSLSSPL
jgi:hypothetical protein